MGRESLGGPATSWIAGELRAEVARRDLTHQQVADMTGVAKTTVQRALKGDTALAVEVLLQLCEGLGMDVGGLVVKALDHME